MSKSNVLFKESNVIPFQFNRNEIRTIHKDDDSIWFVAKDVCVVLSIRNTTQAINILDEDERAMFCIGRQGEANIINESGLYTLILRSNKPEAKAFRKWVTSRSPTLHPKNRPVRHTLSHTCSTTGNSESGVCEGICPVQRRKADP